MTLGAGSEGLGLDAGGFEVLGLDAGAFEVLGLDSGAFEVLGSGADPSPSLSACRALLL